jgi:radical SAM protein with 4Fe4S-binding SPASM domain
MENSIYILNPDYIFKNDNQRILVYTKSKTITDCSKGWLSMIHPLQAMILSFFSHDRIFTENIKVISQFLNVSYEKAKQLILPFIENPTTLRNRLHGKTIAFPKNLIIKKGNLQGGTSFSPDDMKCKNVDIETKRLFSGPIHLTLMLTNRCITRCKYCYADTETKYNNALSTEKIFDLIHEAHAEGIKAFHLIGGETILHKDWHLILKETVRLNMSPDIISTKIPITWEIINKFKDAQYTDKIQISLDTISSDLLQKSLGVNKSYSKKVIKGIQILDNSGCRYQIATVLTQYNDNPQTMQDLYTFIKRLKNIECWSVTPAMNTLYKNYHEFVKIKSNRNRVEELYSFFEKQIIPNTNIKINLGRSYLDRTYYKSGEGSSSFKGAGCSALNNHLFVLPDGNVTICEQLYWNPNFIIGNVNENSLNEIWNSQKALSLAHMRNQNIQDKSKCHSCGRFQDCFDNRNRCWADIIKAYGDDKWDFPDPRCNKAPKMTYNLAF